MTTETSAGTSVGPTAEVTDGDLEAASARRVAAVRAAREAGMTTAEYAVGTVAACGFGALLFKVVTSDTVRSLLTNLIKQALTLSL